MPEESSKRKLTLSVDEDVVEKAKTLNINISEMTEAMLRGFAFKPTELELDAVYRHYQELFNAMLTLLREYQTSVVVAERTVYDDNEEPLFGGTYLLDNNGKIWFTDEEGPTDIRDIPLYCFRDPMVILSRFVKALSEAKEQREEQINKLEMAKQLILAMTQSLTKGAAKEVKTNG